MLADAWAHYVDEVGQDNRTWAEYRRLTDHDVILELGFLSGATSYRKVHRIIAAYRLRLNEAFEFG